MQFVLSEIHFIVWVSLNLFAVGALLKKFMQGLFWEILEEKGALIWLRDKWGSILLFDLLAGKICKGI